MNYPEAEISTLQYSDQIKGVIEGEERLIPPKSGKKLPLLYRKILVLHAN